MVQIGLYQAKTSNNLKPAHFDLWGSEIAPELIFL